MTQSTRSARPLAAAAACAALLLASCTQTSAEPAQAVASAADSSAATPTATATAQLPSVQVAPTGTPAAALVGTVVAAAGDIACVPSDSEYNKGLGTPTACRQRATSDLIVAMKPAAVLAMGDLQYEVGRLDAFRASYDRSWGRFKKITYPAPGNHEYGTGVTRGYFEYFGPRAARSRGGYYSAEIAGWHVVSLNSNCDEVGGCQRGSAQEKWLRADLAAHPAACTLAIWHEPRWSSGLHGSNDKVDGLWRALAVAGADVVLAGHDHDYERFAPLNANGAVDRARGLREFVVGTGGRSLYPMLGATKGSEVHDFQTFGVLKLTLRPTGYSWQFLPVAGSAFTDSGSGSCH